MKISKAFVILILTIINLLLIVYLVFFKFISGGLNFQSPALIGDFVGGVIGTILTAIAAIFVYKTYRNQDDQLKLQKWEANQKLVDSLYDRIAKDVDDLEVTQYNEYRGNAPITYKSINVLYNLTDLLKLDNSVLNQLALILISFEHLCEIEKSFEYNNPLQHTINQDRIHLFFYARIIWPLHKFYGNEWKKLLEPPNPHPDSKETLERFERLVKKTYCYLLARKLVGMPVDNAYSRLLQERC